MTIPNIIDPSVPIGKDDSENVEIQKYGEPVSSPSILYIMASISAKLITPSTTALLIIKGGTQ